MLKSFTIICCYWFLLLWLLVFALYIEVLLCWVHRYLKLFYLLGLISWSLCSILVFCNSLILKSILSEMNIVIPPLFWFPFEWNTFFHLVTFNQYVSLGLKLVSCRQHIYGCCFCICSASLCLLSHAFNPFTFKVIIDTYVPIAIFLIILCFFIGLF